MAGIRGEFEQLLESGYKDSELTIQGNTYFQRKAFGIISEKLERDLPNKVISEIAASIFPLVDLMTSPRSIAEYQELKRVTIDRMYNSQELDEYSPGSYLCSLAWGLKLFPPGPVIDLYLGKIKSKTYWNYFEDLKIKDIRTLKPSEKVVSYQDLLSILERRREQEDYLRVGATTGKWRLNTHSEHRETLRLAKECLGPKSILIAFIEGSESVKLRRGNDHYVEADEERIKCLADEPWVDYVCILDPKLSDDNFLKAYYEQIWKDTKVGYYFVGARKHPLTVRFSEQAQRLGVILLWAREKNSVSTSNAVKEISKGNYT